MMEDGWKLYDKYWKTFKQWKIEAIVHFVSNNCVFDTFETLHIKNLRNLDLTDALDAEFDGKLASEIDCFKFSGASNRPFLRRPIVSFASSRRPIKQNVEMLAMLWATQSNRIFHYSVLFPQHSCCGSP